MTKLKDFVNIDMILGLITAGLKYDIRNNKKTVQLIYSSIKTFYTF